MERRSYSGKSNPNYGNHKPNPGYAAIHLWIARENPPPTRCPDCGEEKKLEAHSLSGKHLRDVSDWVWLCCRCHWIRDGRHAALLERNKTLLNPNRDPSTGRFVCKMR